MKIGIKLVIFWIASLLLFAGAGVDGLPAEYSEALLFISW